MSKEELRKLASLAVTQHGVTKIPTGARTIDLTDREWGDLIRGNKRLEGGSLVDVLCSAELEREQVREANGYFKS